MASPIKVRILGDKDLQRKFKSLPRKAQRAMGAASYAAAVNTMKKSKPLVPVDTGRLKGSGYVTVPRGRADRIVEMGYGGPSNSYAVRVHEDTSMAHPRGGQAKFLEAAVNATRSENVEIMKRVAGAALQKDRIVVRQDPDLPLTPWSGRRE